MQRGSARTLPDCADLFWAAILWWTEKWHLLFNFTHKIDDDLEKFHINLTNSSNMLCLCRWLSGWRTTLFIEIPSPRDQGYLLRITAGSSSNSTEIRDANQILLCLWNLKQSKLLGRWLEIISTQQTLAEAEIESTIRLLSHKVKLPPE